LYIQKTTDFCASPKTKEGFTLEMPPCAVLRLRALGPIITMSGDIAGFEKKRWARNAVKINPVNHSLLGAAT
jgi:hypothetical protein